MKENYGFLQQVKDENIFLIKEEQGMLYTSVYHLHEASSLCSMEGNMETIAGTDCRVRHKGAFGDEGPAFESHQAVPCAWEQGYIKLVP